MTIIYLRGRPRKPMFIFHLALALPYTSLPNDLKRLGDDLYLPFALLRKV